MLAAVGAQLAATPLGEGEVDEVSFIGAQERLRLKLPTSPGVRVIHPPRRFGESDLPIEVVRSQHDARRLRLGPGDRVQVGIRRFHVLLHPGLSLLLADVAGAAGEPARRCAAEIARLAQARLSCASPEAALSGSGTEELLDPADLFVAGG